MERVQGSVLSVRVTGVLAEASAIIVMGLGLQSAACAAARDMCE